MKKNGLSITDIKNFLYPVNKDLILTKRVISYIEGINVDSLGDDCVPKKYNNVKDIIIAYINERNIKDIINYEKIIIPKEFLLELKIPIASKKGIESNLSVSDVKKFIYAHEDFELVAKRVISYVMQVPTDLIGVENKLVIISDYYKKVKDFLENYLNCAEIFDLVVNDLFIYESNDKKQIA